MKMAWIGNAARHRATGGWAVLAMGLVMGFGMLRAADFRDGERANLVVGQTDFDGRFGTEGGATGFRGAVDVAVDPVTGKLFVVDGLNNRILRFGAAESLSNGAPAEAVLGQADFTGTEYGVGAQRLWFPVGIFVDSRGRLWVADRTNSRVLMWENAGNAASGAAASRVLGQVDFDSRAGVQPPTAASLLQPTDVFVDARDTLWVTDEGNRRVLRYDQVTTKANGAPADGVLGQPDFVSREAAGGTGGLAVPFGVTGDALGNLYVVDAGANRVLRFTNAGNLPNGAPASAVFGQADFEATGFATTARTLSQPYAAAVGPDGALWVADTLNRRVLRYASPAAATVDPPANLVLGEPDFTTAAGKIGAALLAAPTGLGVDARGNVWVADCDNSRVLRFSPAVDPIPARPVVLTREPRRLVGSQLPFRLSGRALHATTVYYQRDVAKPFFRRSEDMVARLAGERWSLRVKVPPRRKILLRVWAVGPGGRSRPLTFVLTRERERE